MATKLPAPKLDWALEAWRLASVIGALPTNPPGPLAEFTKWPRNPQMATELEALRSALKLHLQYRINKELPPPKSGRIWDVPATDSRVLAQALNHFATRGFKLRNEDKAAVFTLSCINHILEEGYASEHLKMTLPLTVASIAGKSVRFIASMAGSVPKLKGDRRSVLAILVADERRRDPFAQYSEVLDRLCSDRSIQYKNEQVFYTDKKNKPRSVKLARFRTIFSEQSPSKAAGKKRKPATS